jgi:hypothetical protein
MESFQFIYLGGKRSISVPRGCIINLGSGWVREKNSFFLFYKRIFLEDF